MYAFSSLQIESRNGTARVTLHRPDRRNAFDARMVNELCEAFDQLGGAEGLRAVVLTGEGPVFCAGADVRWIGPERAVSSRQAKKDAEQLVMMFRAIDECPLPVIGRIQGAAFGGGVGLIAACDIAVAAEDVTLALSEARLGLVPAVIAPMLLRKAGESFLRRFCLTGESFSPTVAKQFHLVHDVVPRDRLDTRVSELLEAILRLAPQAVRQTKELIRRISSPRRADPWKLCAEANARARLSEEAKEGLSAFLDKRVPAWLTSKADQGPQPDSPRARHVAGSRR